MCILGQQIPNYFIGFSIIPEGAAHCHLGWKLVESDQIPAGQLVSLRGHSSM